MKMSIIAGASDCIVAPRVPSPNLLLMKLATARALSIFAFAVCSYLARQARGEAMVQYFNTDWNEIAQKMPELAEAGYDSIWLPPPTQGKRRTFCRLRSLGPVRSREQRSAWLGPHAL